ncbi:MAG: hypothetical protein B7733_02155 [Myxococcales bacterium FL481]|nr:MAG: hypothetical protein B7733_02155 [Myxococcales bacterium FL481]
MSLSTNPPIHIHVYSRVSCPQVPRTLPPPSNPSVRAALELLLRLGNGVEAGKRIAALHVSIADAAEATRLWMNVNRTAA